MQQSLEWHLLRTRNGMEKKVETALTRSGIAHYRALAGPATGMLPAANAAPASLFQALLFVKIAAAQEAFVKQVKGVTGFVYWLEQPLIVPEAEMDILRQFMGRYVAVKLEKISVDANTPALITEGFYNMHDGYRTAATAAIAVLPSLGYKLSAAVAELPVTATTGRENAAPLKRMHTRLQEMIYLKSLLN